MISLIYSVLLFFSFSSTSFGFAGAWSSCGSNNDCIKVNAGCGRLGSINKKYYPKHENFMRKTAEVSSCRQPTAEAMEADKKLISVCIEKRCEITNPN